MSLNLLEIQNSDEPVAKYTGTREREERTERDRGPGKDKERGFREREKERKTSKEEPSRGKNVQGTYQVYSMLFSTALTDTHLCVRSNQTSLVNLSSYQRTSHFHVD